MVAATLDSDVAAIADSVGDIAEDFAGKTMLLGGGRGFLGRYFTAVFDHLNRGRLSRPCTLIVLDNLITTHDEAPPPSPHYRFVEHDVSRPLELDTAPDFVVNAAGIASPYYYRAYPLETLGAAISGNANLLECAAEHGARFTFFSSSEIYGDPMRRIFRRRRATAATSPVWDRARATTRASGWARRFATSITDTAASPPTPSARSTSMARECPSATIACCPISRAASKGGARSGSTAAASRRGPTAMSATR